MNPYLANYTPLPGVADELFDADGTMRPVWAPFMDQLGSLSPADLAAHLARGDQYLRDAGVYYRHYGEDQTERDWPLSHIPVILHEDDWARLCDGLAQRADLLEQVVADLYGDNRLVAEGHLPAELIAQNPEWLRPLVGVKPASGHFLHLLAFEIGRSPDGSWLVLGDRTQAPSGAGFALENRVATARMFPEPFPRANTLRLAGFFRAFRDAMNALPGARDRQAAVLSPGQGNDTYFEHSYIARYLGLMLLEGEDLIVQDGAVQVRTVSGPQPVGVLWRRLDAAYADPLELEESSQIGTAGLVEALRRSNVNMVNALGSGILETRAFMAFLPKLAQVLLGGPLTLPNIATWWCGQDAERAYVRDNADALFIGDALSRGLPFEIGTGETAIPEGQTLGRWIETQGARLVAQEPAKLSTSPAWDGAGLTPRPMSIRVFAARTPDGWVFLPGGYARIGQPSGTTALSMQSGGSVADVWVMRDGPVPEETLFEPGTIRRQETGALPSRVADNLYWLGRYIERTECAIRLLRAYHLRLTETGNAADVCVTRIESLLGDWGLSVDAPLDRALESALGPARHCARRMRDRFADDGWNALADLTSQLENLSGHLIWGDDTARMLGVLLRKITGFNGLVHENMHRSSGWRFLTFGRALERADGVTAVLDRFATGEAVPGLPGVALEFGDSTITHQRRYRIEPIPATAIDLLALDRHNPRAVLYQLTTMRRIAQDLPFAEVHGRVSPVLKLLRPLETRLTVAEPGDLDTAALADIRQILNQVSIALSATYMV